jgi:hypothetical protein
LAKATPLFVFHPPFFGRNRLTQTPTVARDLDPPQAQPASVTERIDKVRRPWLAVGHVEYRKTSSDRWHDPGRSFTSTDLGVEAQDERPAQPPWEPLGSLLTRLLRNVSGCG